MPELVTQKDGDVTTITINRPEIGNLVSDVMMIQLTDMVDAAAKDSRLILFRGAGNDFCRGREGMLQAAPVLEAYALRERFDTVFELYDAFRRSKVPVVGVVQGRAAGLGCALAGLCDITIASDTARFSLPEMAHNIMPTAAMSALVDCMPHKALMYLVYSTQEIDARKALFFGLVSQVVPAGDLENAVAALVERMKKTPMTALMAAKEYARSAFAMNTQAATDFARNLHATINSSSTMRD